MIILFTIIFSLSIISVTADIREGMPMFVYIQYCFVGTLFIYMLLSFVL